MKVMVSGIKGDMSSRIAKRAVHTDGYELVPVSLGSHNVGINETVNVEGVQVRLIHPDHSESGIKQAVEEHGPFLAIDFTNHIAADKNVLLYVENGISFVMGTTNINEEALIEAVTRSDSGVSAVVAPNMAPLIVIVQAMFEFAAQEFKNAFDGLGYDVMAEELHQSKKKLRSGTAEKMIACLAMMGLPCSVEDIRSIRNKAFQRRRGIAEPFLDGHAHHSYEIASPEGDVYVCVTHDVEGRTPYVDGTFIATEFLQTSLAGITGQIYSMRDVLGGV